MQQDDRRADCCFPGTQNTRPAVGRAPHPSAAENGPWLTSAVLNHMPSVIVSGCRDMATLSPTYFLRRATPDDAPAIRAIEECSVQKFSTIPDLAHLAQPGTFTPNSISGLNTWLSRGRVFLVMDSSASEPKAVGIIAALPKDNTIYIAEISVLAEHNGKGVGGMLLNAVFDWARELAIQTGEEVSRVSLTCYKDVPWNGPWYRRKGFVEVEAESLGIEHEEKMELDRKVRKLEVGGYKRCCMLWTEQRGRV